jgi:hypothetical protein
LTSKHPVPQKIVEKEAEQNKISGSYFGTVIKSNSKLTQRVSPKNKQIVEEKKRNQRGGSFVKPAKTSKLPSVSNQSMFSLIFVFR